MLRGSRIGVSMVLLSLVLAACGGSGVFDTTSSPGTTAGNTTGTTGTTSAGTVPPTTTPGGSAAYHRPADELTVLDTEQWGLVVADEILVTVADGEGSAVAGAAATAVGGEVVGWLPSLNLFQIRVPVSGEAGLTSAIRSVSGVPGVVAAGVDWVDEPKESIEGRACRVLDFETYRDEQGIPYRMTGVEEAYALLAAAGFPVGTEPVVVGVADEWYLSDGGEGDGAVEITGLGEWDEAPGAFTDTATDGHGTAVANTIGADWSDGGVMGTAGGMPAGSIEVVVADIYGSVGSSFTTLTRLEQLIDEAGAGVINMSFGPEEPDPRYTTERFREFAAAHPDVLFVVAAGNESGGLDGDNYRYGGVDLPNVITVGGLDNDGSKRASSNFAVDGGEVTLAAPAEEVPVGIDASTGEVVTWSGTSFATPQVAATAAMLKALDPSLTAAQIKEILVRSAATEIADPEVSDRIIAVDPSLGGRVLRVDNAVMEVLQRLPAVRERLGREVTREALLALATIEATATVTGPLTFLIEATLPATGSGGADVEVTQRGEGLLSGPAVVHLDGPGSAQWAFDLLSEANTARLTLTRTDSGACSRLSLEAPAFAFSGTYEGSMPGALMPDIEVPDVPVTFVVDELGAMSGSFDATATFELQGATVELSGGGTCTGTVATDGTFACTGRFEATGTVTVPGGMGSSGTNTGTWEVVGSIDAGGVLRGTLSTSGSTSSSSDVPVTAVRVS